MAGAVIVGTMVAVEMEGLDVPGTNAVGNRAAAVGGTNRVGVTCGVQAARPMRMPNSKVRVRRPELEQLERGRNFMSPKYGQTCFVMSARLGLLFGGHRSGNPCICAVDAHIEGQSYFAAERLLTDNGLDLGQQLRVLANIFLCILASLA